MMNRKGIKNNYSQVVLDHLTGKLCEIRMPSSSLGKLKGFEYHGVLMQTLFRIELRSQTLVQLYHKYASACIWRERGVIVDEPVLILEPIRVFTPADREKPILGVKALHPTHGVLFQFWEKMWPEILEAST